MSMSKKDFVALADAVKDKGLTENQLWALENFCQQQNPRFDADRWRRYLRGECGPSGGKR